MNQYLDKLRDCNYLKYNSIRKDMLLDMLKGLNRILYLLGFQGHILLKYNSIHNYQYMLLYMLLQKSIFQGKILNQLHIHLGCK